VSRSIHARADAETYSSWGTSIPTSGGSRQATTITWQTVRKPTRRRTDSTEQLYFAPDATRELSDQGPCKGRGNRWEKREVDRGERWRKGELTGEG